MHGSLIWMATSGLLASVVAPLLVVAVRDTVGLGPLDHRAVIALPGFVVLHAALALGIEGGMWPASVHAAGAVVLLAGAMVFWSPVLGRAHRLGTDLGCGYLFLAAPALDLPAVVMIAAGDSSGGLAMIVAMLPLGLIAVGRTWRWLIREDRGDREDRLRTPLNAPPPVALPAGDGPS